MLSLHIQETSGLILLLLAVIFRPRGGQAWEFVLDPSNYFSNFKYPNDWTQVQLRLPCFGQAGSSMLLQKLKIDDPVDASPVHGFCGIWGVLACGFFDWGKGVVTWYQVWCHLMSVFFFSIFFIFILCYDNGSLGIGCRVTDDFWPRTWHAWKRRDDFPMAQNGETLCCFCCRFWLHLKRITTTAGVASGAWRTPINPARPVLEAQPLAHNSSWSAWWLCGLASCLPSSLPSWNSQARSFRDNFLSDVDSGCGSRHQFLWQ